MAGEVSLLVLVHVFVVLMQFGTFVVSGEPQVPCNFIFGDSLVDSGNNNGLKTAAKANYAPYGIDFPHGATGRFTNGRTMADIIGQHLGFEEFIPPYSTATDEQISKGVNYASGSSGIREESGSQLGDRISMDRQLLNHKTTISRMQHIAKLTQEHLNKCIYLVNMGCNDYINNYLMPNMFNTSHIYTPDQYAEVLVKQYSQQLTTLYNLGARKIAVFGLGRIGCTPAEIAKLGTNGKPCVESINDVVKLFNDKLKLLVDELNRCNSNARFTFINISRISSAQEVIALANTPCCKVREDGQCIPNTTPCPIRALALSFDGFHPTEAANIIIATISYSALSSEDASPYNIRTLARLRP